MWAISISMGGRGSFAVSDYTDYLEPWGVSCCCSGSTSVVSPVSERGFGPFF